MIINLVEPVVCIQYIHIYIYKEFPEVFCDVSLCQQVITINVIFGVLCFGVIVVVQNILYLVNKKKVYQKHYSIVSNSIVVIQNKKKPSSISFIVTL